MDYFAGQFAFETRTDGTDFLSEEILGVEDDKDVLARTYSPEEQRRLYRSMLEEKAMQTVYDVDPDTGKRTVAEAFADIPEDILLGVFLRNMKSMENFANELSGDRFKLGITPEFEDRDSLVADLVEPIPLIAASFTPAGLVARGLQASRWGMRLYKVASSAVPRKLLPKGLKMLSSASFFSAFQSMKGAVERDKDGKLVAPKHKYGLVASPLVDETPEEAQARYQAYRNAPLWGRVGSRLKGQTVDEVVLEMTVLGAGALALKGAKASVPLIKRGGGEVMKRLDPYLDPLLRKTDFERQAKLDAIKKQRHLRDFENLSKLETAEFERMVKNDEIPDDIMEGYLNYNAVEGYKKNVDLLNAYSEWQLLQSSGRKRIIDGNRIIEIREKPKPLVPKKDEAKDIVKPKRALVDIQVNISKLAGAARISKKKLAEATNEYISILADDNVPKAHLTDALKAIGRDARDTSVEILELQSKAGAVDEKKIARLKNKKKHLDDLYEQTKGHAKASPDVLEEQEALERLLSHENLGQTAERLKKIQGPDREEMFRLMKGLANGEIDSGDVKIYQSISKGMSFAKAMDVYQKTVIGAMLLGEAFVKAVIGNTMESAVRKSVVGGKVGLTTAPGRLWRGVSNVGKLAVARGRSKEYMIQSWETMRGVKTSQAFTERNLPYSGIQPMAEGALEQGLNVVPGAVFKSLEVLDEVSTALNSPEVMEGVLFDLAVRTSKGGKATKEQAQARMLELAQQINKKLVAGDTKDPLVKQFLELSDEESKRLAFRADVAKDPDAYGWVKKASEFSQGIVAKNMDDAWYKAMAKTFFQTTVFPFVNTGINVSYRAAESLHGAGILLSGRGLKSGGLTAAERTRMLDAPTRIGIAYGLLTYGLNADNPIFKYRPARPGEDAKELRDAGSVIVPPDRIQLGKGTVGLDSLAATGMWMVALARLQNMSQIAADNGDMSILDETLKATKEVTSAALPGQVHQNIAELMEALDAEKSGEGRRYFKRKLKDSIKQAVPGAALAKKYRQGKTEGVFSRQGVPERPSESFFTGDAADVFLRATENITAIFRDAYGVDGEFVMDRFGEQVGSVFQATKDDPFMTILPTGHKGAPSKETLAKYQGVTIFASEMGLFGRSDEETEAESDLGAQDIGNALRLPSPPRRITVRKHTVRHLEGTDEKVIDRSKTAQVTLAPQHQNLLRSLVGRHYKNWDKLHEEIAEHAEEDVDHFEALRMERAELWERWGADPEKDGIMDILARVVAADPEKLEEEFGADATVALNEIVRGGLYPHIYRGMPYEELSKEQFKQTKAVMFVNLYSAAYDIAKKAMSMHPEYQDNSPALQKYRQEEAAEEAAIQGNTVP